MDPKYVKNVQKLQTSTQTTQGVRETTITTTPDKINYTGRKGTSFADWEEGKSFADWEEGKSFADWEERQTILYYTMLYYTILYYNISKSFWARAPGPNRF